MRLWDFAHGLSLLGKSFHFYEFLGAVLIAVMIIGLIVHFIVQKKRKNEYEDDLRAITTGGPVPLNSEQWERRDRV